nr:IS66 family transposase [Mesorhizobium amorphae]
MSELAGFAGTLQADGFSGYVAAVHMWPCWPLPIVN